MPALYQSPSRLAPTPADSNKFFFKQKNSRKSAEVCVNLEGQLKTTSDNLRIDVIRLGLRHPLCEDLDGFFYAVTDIEATRPSADHRLMFDRVKSPRFHRLADSSNFLVDRLEYVLDVSLEDAIDGRADQQAVDVPEVVERGLPRDVLVFLSQVVDHGEGDSVILFAGPSEVHRVVDELRSVNCVDGLELIAVERLQDEFVVASVVLDLVKAGELNVEDDPMAVVGKVLQLLRFRRFVFAASHPVLRLSWTTKCLIN